MRYYGVGIAALVLLAVFGLRRYLSFSKKRAATDVGGAIDFLEERLEFAPHGQVLRLTRPVATTRPLRPNAVFEKLRHYVDGTMPFVGIVIDCGGSDYRFSSADLGGVASASAAWVRGWVAPCAIVITGEGARHMQRLLDITTLAKVEQLRIVDTVDAARTHLMFHLERRSR